MPRFPPGQLHQEVSGGSSDGDGNGGPCFMVRVLSVNILPHSEKCWLTEGGSA